MTGALLAAIAAWLLVCIAGHARRPALETGPAWALAMMGVVAGTGIFLGAIGAIGALGAMGFAAAHAGLCGGRLVLRKSHRAADTEILAALFRGVRQRLDWRTGDGVCALVLLVALGVLLAIGAEPVVYDALTYRLSRIGAWLQSGRIAPLAADDSRVNYMPVVPDLVMAWLMTSLRAGYAFTAVAQALGGAMTLAATIGLARQTGLSRRAAIFAAALLLGMANVVRNSPRCTPIC